MCKRQPFFDNRGIEFVINRVHVKLDSKWFSSGTVTLKEPPGGVQLTDCTSALNQTPRYEANFMCTVMGDLLGIFMRNETC
jgi:hypothetical protein